MALPTAWEEGTVEANGIDVHYTRTGGDGPPIVIAHGVFDDGPCRTPLARDLADDYDVIMYDARGHGRTDAPETGYDIENRVADLVGLIEALGLEDPYLFGHSMGGDTVAATAARHPELPRAVVMEDPGAMLEHDDDGREGVPAWARERIDRWNDSTKEELLVEDDELREHREAGKSELASLLADARLRVSQNVTGVFENDSISVSETYSAIEAPTLVIKADADEEGKRRDRERASHLTNGRLVHVEDTGHCVFRDDREAATRELRAFLAER